MKQHNKPILKIETIDLEDVIFSSFESSGLWAKDRVCKPADEINIGDNLGLYLYYLYKLSLHEKHEGFLIIKISKTNNIFIEKT